MTGLLSTRMIAGLMVAASKSPEPEPPLSKEEEIRIELTKARVAMIEEQGSETRQQRRHRDRREAKALASYQKHQARKKFK